VSNKSREVIFGGRIRGAKIRAKGAREEAVRAVRAADRAEAESVVDPNGRYGGSARPSPTITQCLNGGYGWLQVKCRRCETEASIPLEHVRRPRDTIWKLEAALKCRSCRTPRYSPPVNMIRLTEECQTFPTFGFIQTMISKPLSSGLIVSFLLKARLHHLVYLASRVHNLE
jgi:hypothetical protein